MGLTQKLGTIPLAVFTDSSNNVGIGGAANASFKLQVTGATNVTGVLTLGSTISNGTYTYTLPSATGTLALTSDIPSLTGYVPYTGATTNVNIGNNNYLGGSILLNQSAGSASATGYLSLSGSTGAGTGAIVIGLGSGTSASMSFPTSSNYSYIFPATSGTLALTSDLSAYLPLTGGTLTGALSGTSATFSSSVGIGGTPTTKFELFGSSGNFQIASSGAEVFFTRDGNNDILANAGTSAGIRFGGQQQLRFATGSSLTTRLTIDATGAATFSGEIKSGDTITLGAAAVGGFWTWGSTISYLVAGTGKALNLNPNGATGTTGLSIATTGAATFSNQVTINGPSSNWAAVIQNTNSGSGTSYGLKVQAGTSSGADATFVLQDYAGNEFFTARGNGRIGIGTNSPAGKVDIAAGTGANILIAADATNLVSINNYSSASGFQDLKIVGANQLFFTGTAGGGSVTERMRITSGGNVGIGTSSPSTLLHISGAGTGQMLRIQNTSTVSGDQGPLIQFVSANQVGGQGFESGYIQSIWTSEGNGFAMRFATKQPDGGQVERVRITSGGFVLINSTSVSAGYKLKVEHSGSGGILAAATGTGDANFFSSSDSIGYHFYCDRGSAARFYVIGTGQIYSTSTSITAISDIRHKENIRPLETGLTEILQLKPSRFDWKEGKGTGKKDVAGFIAQDIEEILPDLVDEWKETMQSTEAFKSIRMGDLIPTLVKAIQEQQEQIEELKALIAAK